MSVNFGALDRWVTLESRCAPDSVDPTAAAWTRERDEWAARVPIQGGERFFGSGVLNESSAIFRFRHFDDYPIGSTWRIVDQDEVWYVTSIQVLHRKGQALVAANRNDPTPG